MSDKPLSNDQMKAPTDTSALVGEVSYHRAHGRWYITLHVPKWLMNDLEAACRVNGYNGLRLASMGYEVGTDTKTCTITFAPSVDGEHYPARPPRDEGVHGE